MEGWPRFDHMAMLVLGLLFPAARLFAALPLLLALLVVYYLVGRPALRASVPAVPSPYPGDEPRPA